MNIKNHNFYDSGVYNLGNTNAATAYGFGIQAQRKITKRIGLSFGYGLSLADSLKESEGYTRNAVYHQFEGNLTLQPQNRKRIKPYLFTGYAINAIPQLKELGESAAGLNINVGGGLEVKLKEYIGIAYQMTYGFSLARSIPYNFRHQLGVVLYPSKFIGCSPKAQQAGLNEQYVDYAQRDSLQAAVDSSPLRVAATLKGEELLQKESSINDNLEEEIRLLELENQLLLQELRSHRFLSDSIYSKSFAAYTMLGSDGKVLTKEASSLTSGFYLVTEKKATLKEVKAESTNSVFSSIGTLYFLNREEYFVLLGFVGSDREEALSTARAAKVKGVQVSVVRIP